MSGQSRRHVLVTGAQVAAALVATKLAGLFPETAAEAAAPPTGYQPPWSRQELGGADISRLRSVAGADVSAKQLAKFLTANGSAADGTAGAARITGPEGDFDMLFVGHGNDSHYLFIEGVASIAVLAGRDVFNVRDGRVVPVQRTGAAGQPPRLRPSLLPQRSGSSQRGPGLASPLSTHCQGPCDDCIFWYETCLAFLAACIWAPPVCPTAFGICATANYYCWRAQQCGNCFS